MAIPIHHLTQDQSPLVVVSPGENLEMAVGMMLEHDFSQLPVVENGRPFGKPASFVTSNSVARALRIFGSPLNHLRVRDAIVPAPTVASDDDAFARMDELLGAYAVLVLKPDGTLGGIVTNHDTTQYFRRRAEDMLLVEDIETTLKDHIRGAFGGDEGDPDGPLKAAVNLLSTPTDTIREACRKSFRRFCAQQQISASEQEIADVVERPFKARSAERTFEDLSLYDYIELACRPEAWAKLEPVFGIPKDAFRAMLEGVRKTRNKLMHFRADIDAIERDRLRFCAGWFKYHPPVLDGVGSLFPASELPTSRPAEVPADEAAPDGALAYTPNEQGDSKYAPLARYLAGQPRSLERVALTFSEIETIIESELPAAARDHRAWWSNDTTAHVQSAQWLDVNWRVVSINMTSERVVFARARDRERAYIEFFSTVQSRLRSVTDFPLVPANPTGQNWLPIGHYPGTGITLVVSFARRRRLRMEGYIDSGDAGMNERLFTEFMRRQELLENAVGASIEWEQLVNRRACRFALYTSGTITDEPGELEALVGWIADLAPRMHRGIAEILPSIAAGERAQDGL